ncbi:hypothetical protein HY490_05300 [Candidatus Woesearchaeota archaeon]|nr:hypothetical protein [Candidatus Woesearchaeota archaeon]
MRRTHLAQILLISLLIGIGIGTIMYTLIVPVEHHTIKASARAGEYFGFDLNTTELTFGTIQPGRNRERDFTITNTHDYPVEADLKIYGDIARIMTLSDTLLLLNPQQNSTIRANVHMNSNATYDTRYNGSIEVILRRKW